MVSFEDGQRALRLIKSLAPQYHYEATKVGVMGFSAGGHLAGMLATVPQRRFYKPIDELDSLTADVQFATLLYPVVTMLPPYNKPYGLHCSRPGPSKTGFGSYHIIPKDNSAYS